MSDRSSDGDDPRPYVVGYGRPPKHSQFKKKQSGNPRGRAPGSKNLRTILIADAAKRLKITEGGKTRSITRLEGMVMRLSEKALKGENRSIDKYIDTYIRVVGPGEEPVAPAEDLSAQDAAILEAIMADMRLPKDDDDGS